MWFTIVLYIVVVISFCICQTLLINFRKSSNIWNWEKKKKKRMSSSLVKTPGQCGVHISLKIPFSFKPFHSSVIYMWSCYLKGLFSMIFIFFWDEENLTVRSFHIYNTIIFSLNLLLWVHTISRDWRPASVKDNPM